MAQLTSCSDIANAKQLNVAIAPVVENKLNCTGWNSSISELWRFWKSWTAIYIWAQANIARMVPKHALNVVVSSPFLLPIVATSAMIAKSEVVQIAFRHWILLNDTVMVVCKWYYWLMYSFNFLIMIVSNDSNKKVYKQVLVEIVFAIIWKLLTSRPF